MKRFLDSWRSARGPSRGVLVTALAVVIALAMPLRSRPQRRRQPRRPDGGLPAVISVCSPGLRMPVLVWANAWGNLGAGGAGGAMMVHRISSRRLRIVVAEHDVSAVASWDQLNRSSCSILSGTSLLSDHRAVSPTVPIRVTT
jgi:anti-sigma factor RsiW